MPAPKSSILLCILSISLSSLTHPTWLFPGWELQNFHFADLIFAQVTNKLWHYKYKAICTESFFSGMFSCISVLPYRFPVSLSDCLSLSRLWFVHAPTFLLFLCLFGIISPGDILPFPVLWADIYSELLMSFSWFLIFLIAFSWHDSKAKLSFLVPKFCLSLYPF